MRQESGDRSQKKGGWSLFLIGLQSGEELHVPSFRAVAAYFNENSACVRAGFKPAPINFYDKWSWHWAPPPSMKMPWRYRADGAWLVPPRKIGPSWLVQVHRICLAKPKTNSCAGPRKAGQGPHPLRRGHRSSTCSITRFMPKELHLSSPTRPGTFKQAFPAFAKRPGAPSPPETNPSPGWLALEPVAPAPPTMDLTRGRLHFRDECSWHWVPPPSMKTGRNHFFPDF